MPDVEDPWLTMEEAATFIKFGAENIPPAFKIFFEGIERHYEAETRKSFQYKFLVFSKNIGVLSQVLFMWNLYDKITNKVSIFGR